MVRTILPALTLCLGVAAVSAAEPLPPRETIEWCNLWWENTGDQTLPRVLLIGDSITWQYRGAVAQRLKGVANVDCLATSKAMSDPALLRELDLIAGDYRYAVIHFNNGLHGGHVTGDQFEAGLRAAFERLRQLQPQARCIWASSTPVPSRQEGVVLDPAGNAKVLERNARGAKVAAELQMPVDDLYGVVVGELEQLSARKGDLHYNERGKTLQAEAVTRAIQARLAE